MTTAIWVAPSTNQVPQRLQQRCSVLVVHSSSAHFNENAEFDTDSSLEGFFGGLVSLVRRRQTPGLFDLASCHMMQLLVSQHTSS